MEILLIFFLFPFLIGVFINFDKILKIQYNEHRNEWESDRKPSGFFWKPKEINWLQGYRARNRLSFSWLFKTPDWAKNQNGVAKYFFRLRLLVLTWNIGILILLISILINH